MNVEKWKWYLRTRVTSVMYGKMGIDSYVGKPIYIQRRKNVFIGRKVRIYPGIRIELSQDSAKLKVGDNVSIGQNFHVVSYDGDLIIGKNTTISGNVFVSNVDHEYQEIGVHVLKQKLKTSYTEIGENCFLGYGAVILSGTVLGKQCVIGANAVVRGIYPDYCVLAGNPARVIKRYNKESGKWEKVDG